MTNESYLREILDGQNLTEYQKRNLRELRDKIERQLRSGIRGTPKAYYGGSYAKNTMIKASYDLDLVLYWSSDSPYSLESLYRAAEGVLDRNWRTVKRKKVGLELPFEGDFHIDVIPGKFSSKDENYAYLYNNNTGGRFRTSIYVQVDYVKKSGRQDAIRLMKLWKKIKKVPIKTFILESCIIEGCKGLDRSKLEPQLLTAFRYLCDNIQNVRIVDPSNSNNVISDDLSREQKNRVRNLAIQAIEAQYWRQVFF
ncbi:MAG: hypothetical protein ACXADW_05980 [Candidatus Hodarchaeales archaeon]